MCRLRLVLGVLLATLPAPLRAAEHPATLRSVSVDLPFGDRAFPEGPGSDAVSNNCLACHSAGMILTQPPLPQATWQAEVEKMRAVYKAPIADDDVPAIVDYLVRVKGSQ